MFNNPPILILDDDPNLRKTLSDILKFRGFEIFATGSGTEGLAWLKENPATLALIDLGLPDIPGIEVLKKVKADYPSTQAIIITGMATLDSAIEAANIGAFSYLIKPYEIEQLMLNIRRAIEKQQAERALRKSEEYFRKIFEESPLGMAITDREDRFVKVNRKLCRMRAANGEEAVAYFAARKDEIHLVLLDVIMPRMSGKEAYRKIEQIKPGIKGIFISGYTADIFQKEEMYEEGFNFLSKPIQHKDLLVTVRKLLDS